MKKISIIALILVVTVGIGVINWLAITFCINCTGNVPLFFPY